MQLSQLVSRIKSVALSAGGEEDLRIGFEDHLRQYLRSQGIELQVAPRHEVSLISGRPDAIFGTVIIEYKRPGTLSNRSDQIRARNQLKRYITEVATSAPAERIVGFATDGMAIGLVRSVAGRWTDTEFLELTERSLAEMIRYLRALNRIPLTPEFLVKEFGPGSARAASCIRILYHRFQRTKKPKVLALYQEWVRIFGAVYGEEVKPKHADLFAKTYGIERFDDLRPVLFSLHTFFALLIKLISVEILYQSNPILPSFLLPLPSQDSEVLRSRLESLESGAEFSHLQVRNFLEGDFFAWYLEEWHEDLASAVREIIRGLLEFEPLTAEFRPDETRDLLKKLYQYVVPRPIRQDLGEYYTPDWLAELLLDRAGYQGDLSDRLLDPACGSGTFLVEAIKRIRAKSDAELTDRRELAKTILQNVQGFDINPLAVVAARANYLFALGDLRKHAGEIELPVYLTDSILTPSTESLYPDSSRVLTSVGTFVLPNVLTQKGRMDRFATVLEESVRLEYSAQEFLERIRKEVRVNLDNNTTELLTEVFTKVSKLEKRGRNRIWARILANAFAPIFAGKFDFVVGNPPWVNWEHLAKDYRSATQGLWVEYRLEARAKGKRFELGKMKRDVSMLFTYVCADAYLKNGGILGFLITQTVWKSSGGDVFRRLRLPRGGQMRVLTVDDLSAVRPFEGATNVTSAFVCKKGEPQSFPVPYFIWTRKADAHLETELPWKEARQMLDVRDTLARPISQSDTESPWSTSSREASDVIDKVVGASSYSAKAGCTTWANGVYWVRILEAHPQGLMTIENQASIGRRKIEIHPSVVEETVLFPLLRGRDIRRWFARPSLWIVFPHTHETGWLPIPETVMRTTYPKAYSYLKGFEGILRSRAGYKQLRKDQPFYTLVNTNPDIHAPWKVVWKDIVTDFTSAVLGPDAGTGKPVVPDHHVIYAGFPQPDEAHYLCAILNSVVIRSTIKSFGVMTLLAPHVISRLAIPKYDRGSQLHGLLVELSIRTHHLVAASVEGAPTAEIVSSLLSSNLWRDSGVAPPSEGSGPAGVMKSLQRSVDYAAGRIWGLKPEEIESLHS